MLMPQKLGLAVEVAKGSAALEGSGGGSGSGCHVHGCLQGGNEDASAVKDG